MLRNFAEIAEFFRFNCGISPDLIILIWHYSPLFGVKPIIEFRIEQMKTLDHTNKIAGETKSLLIDSSVHN